MTLPGEARAGRRRHRLVVLLEEIGLLLLLVMAFPLVIAIVGAPMALLMELLVALVQRI